MRVLVTGAHGQLGSDLVRVLSLQSPDHSIVGCGRSELDVCKSDDVLRIVGKLKPDVIVHSAAYTAVDKAEEDIDEAFRINAVGSRNVAIAAESVEAKMCYISTDYVFDGDLERPYREFDDAKPHTIYGQSKLVGEEFVRTLCSRHFIVRTSWVYGKHGSNFVKTMMRLGRERDVVKVVNDQFGSPTYTVDLAMFIHQLTATNYYGIYHATNSGSCTWFAFAQAIFDELGVGANVIPCTTDDFPRPAPRPMNSVLDHLAIRINGFDDLPAWRDALKRFLREETNCENIRDFS